MVKFLDLSEITVEDTPDEIEYAQGDAVVCDIFGCVNRGLHYARVIEVKNDIWLIVEFHDRRYQEIVRKSQVKRYRA